MDAKERCQACTNCKESRDVTVFCLSFGVAMDKELVELYNGRQVDEGVGYVHIVYPVECKWDSNIEPPPPPVPEGKLIRSSFNWEKYKEVRQ